jgi:hypothetical protein
MPAMSESAKKSPQTARSPRLVAEGEEFRMTACPIAGPEGRAILLRLTAQSINPGACSFKKNIVKSTS